MEPGGDRFGVARVAEGDRRAAETAAGHPGADHTSRAADAPGDLHHRVEFRTGDLEVGAERVVAGRHQRPEGLDVAGLEGPGGGDGAGDLAYYVPGPAVDRVAEPIPGGLHVGHGHVSPGGLAEDREPILGVFPAGRIAAVGELVMNVGVGDKHGQAGIGKGHEARLPRAAVDQHEPIGLAEGRGELIHDPAGHAGKHVLGLLAEQGLLAGGERRAGEPFEQRGRRAFKRSGRGEPRPHRHRRHDPGVEPWNGEAAILEATDHTADVIRPLRLARLDGPVERDRGRVARGRADPGLAAAVGRRGDHHGPVEGKGHHESVAIVDVLADQVHSPGGGGGERGLATEGGVQAGGRRGGEIGEGYGGDQGHGNSLADRKRIRGRGRTARAMAPLAGA